MNAYLKERQAEEEKAEQERIQGFNAGFSTEAEGGNDGAGEADVSVEPPPQAGSGSENSAGGS